MKWPWLYEPHLFACLCLPALLRLECCIFICSFWQWRPRGGETMLLPSAECQQICMSKEHGCDDEHFPLEQIPTIRSNSESWLLFLLYSSFTYLLIYSAILHIISLAFRRYYSSWFILLIYVLPFYHFNCSLYFEMYIKSTLFKLVFSHYKLVKSRCVSTGSDHDVHTYEESWKGSHLTFPSTSVCRYLFVWYPRSIHQHNPSQLRWKCCVETVVLM